MFFDDAIVQAVRTLSQDQSVGNAANGEETIIQHMDRADGPIASILHRLIGKRHHLPDLILAQELDALARLSL